MTENSGGGKPVGIIIILAMVVIAIAGAWYGLKYKPEQEAKERARLEQIKKDEAEKQRLEQEARKKQKYEKLISDADVAVDQENWISAKSLYTEASTIYKNEQYPKDQLAFVNEKLDEMAEWEARKAAGIVETVSSSTGRYYVIVSSSVDGDLAMDYAKKLAKEGKNAKVINPIGDDLFSRVTVGDYSTWQEAADASKSFNNYENVWILKF